MHKVREPSRGITARTDAGMDETTLGVAWLLCAERYEAPLLCC